jgi:hypothetical protein
MELIIIVYQLPPCRNPHEKISKAATSLAKRTNLGVKGDYNRKITSISLTIKQRLIEELSEALRRDVVLCTADTC